MKRIILLSTAILFGLLTRAAYAAPCSPSMTFTTGQTLTAPVLNSNPTTFSGCFNNIDNTNIGAAGLYPSQLLPTNSSQATFGGSQNYTFPANLTVNGTLTATGGIGSNFYASAIVPTTGAQATFGGSQLYTFPNGVAAGGPVSGTTGTFSAGVSGTTGIFSSTVSNAGSTSTGAIQQTVSGTTYTAPYDASSTSASTKTHFERGEMTTSTFSAGFACASHNFAPAYVATPIITAVLSGASVNPALLYINAKSASSMQLCVESGSLNTGTALIDWMSLGE
jgi:hypothetical protein